MERYLQKYVKQDLRITVVNVQGDVLYDSFENQKLGNHVNRPEVQKALAEGKGYDVRRTSETTGVPYFYSATLYEGYIIRSALPYDLNLVRHLAADQHYIWFTLIVSLLLIFIFYKFTSKLGTAINQLREFAKRADKMSLWKQICSPPSHTTNWERFHSISSRYTSDCGKPKRHYTLNGRN